MLARCCNDKLESWANYGGRGIKVCDRWRNSFEFFYFDVAAGFQPELQLDRFPDNDGNYTPSNTRWATRTQQANNARTTLYVEVSGKKMGVSELAREIGVKPAQLRRIVGPRRRGLRGPGKKEITPIALDGHTWPQTDEQRVYERAVVQYETSGDVNVCAIAREINADRKYVERVLLRLQKLGLVEIRMPSVRSKPERAA